MLVLGIAIFLLFSAAPGLVGLNDAQPGNLFGTLAQNRVIIGYTSTYVKPNVVDIVRQAGGNIVMEEPKLNFFVAETSNPETLIQRVRGQYGVKYAEKDYIAHTTFIPNDPYWNNQWGPEDIYCPQAWEIERGSQNVLVAVIDTGVDYTHPDLSGRVVLGYDYVNNDNDPRDDHYHGTHCAGIIGAGINNGVGIAGVSNCKILAIKALDSSGSGYYSWIASAIAYAADNGARAISMSLGGTSDSSVLKDACQYAYSKGVLIIAAAGNSGPSDNTVLYPAKYDTVVAVSALSQGDTIAYFSSRGPEVELAAPGDGIYSTVPGGYRSLSGTSMACPHVSGVAGLVFSHNPGLSGTAVRQILTSTAEDLGSSGRDNLYGYGKVHALAAVEAA